MKKIASFILVLVLAFQVVACSTNQEVSVKASNGITLENKNSPSIYIPPNAVEGDAKLKIIEVNNPPDYPNTKQVGVVYDINLDGASLKKPIELSFPITESIDENTDLTIAYYDGNQWVNIPSWISDDGKTINATVDHLTDFGIFSLFNKKPRILSKQASPNPYTGVGFPACFSEGLNITIGADDPDGNLRSVEVRYKIYSLNSALMTGLVNYVNSINGLGLVIYSGNVAGVIPALETVSTLSKTKDPGILVTDWAKIEPSSDDNKFGASLDMSSLSACNTGDLDVDAIMNQQNGIDKIVLELRVTDNAGSVVEDRIDIPVFANEPMFAKLNSPSSGSLQTPFPHFSWGYENSSTTNSRTKACLYYAKNESLWDTWWGKKSENLDEFQQDWQTTQPFSPGNYVWGIVVSSDGNCDSDIAIKSDVYKFTVKSWGDLITETVDSGCEYALSQGVNGSGEIELTGTGGGNWTIEIGDGECNVSKGSKGSPDAKLSVAALDLASVLNGTANPMELYNDGKITMDGDQEVVYALLLLISSFGK